jgi:glycosyltransferase involved in cell wall biosynthesis
MTRLFMTADAVGGVWSYALELAGALAPLGYETSLAVLGPAPGAEQRADVGRIAGLKLVKTGLPLDWTASGEHEVRGAARALAQLAADDGAELIQLNQPAFAAEAMPAPVVAVVHSCVATWWRAAGEGPMPESFAWQTALLRAGLARADRIVCPSAAFAADVRQAYRLPATPAVVHNGRTALAVGTGPLHDFALTAGRLWDGGKNAATLDRAAARLGVPFKAAGPTASPTGETVAFENLHVVGTLSGEALGACFAARPVFASASLYEPFGLAVLEAAQAGCPLVLSDIPTFRELWGESAIFVDPRDAGGFAEAIDALVGDVPLRLMRGEAARQRAERYTPDAMARGMAAIYHTLAGRKAAA